MEKPYTAHTLLLLHTGRWGLSGAEKAKQASTNLNRVAEDIPPCIESVLPTLNPINV